MTADFAALRARLDAFQFAPDFARKLAREQGWSLSHTRQACEEYKRFVCLALASGHACAPSDAVDQVWYQHLLHTEDYWGHFCPEILRAPLHHQTGGSARGDGDKYRDWYRSTLASYRRCFGSAPPAAFWPSPERYLDGDFRRIDRSTRWLLPKPRWPRRLMRTLAAAGPRTPKRSLTLVLASLVVAGCSVIQRVPPFDMAGPSFLLFFVAVWALSLLVVVVVRGMPRAKREHGDVHPYELAYLVDGDWQVVQAVSAAMVQDGRLTLSPAQKLAASPNALQHTDASRAPFTPIERAVVQRCLAEGDTGASPSELLPVVAERRALLTARLEGSGLLSSRAQRRWLLAIALLAPALGLVKIGVGLSIGRPVGFLVFLVAAATLVAWVWLRGERQLTPLGKDLIAELRQHTTQEASTLLSEQPVAMSVALFGSAILAQGAFAELERALASASPMRGAPSWAGSNVSSDGSWGQSGNDWSSSSDSSSSSCSSSSSDGGGSSCSSSSSGCGGCSSSSSSCSSSSSSD